MTQNLYSRVCPRCRKFVDEFECPTCRTSTITPSEWKHLRHTLYNDAAPSPDLLAPEKQKERDPIFTTKFALGLLLGSLGFLLTFLVAYITYGSKMGF